MIGIYFYVCHLYQFPFPLSSAGVLLVAQSGSLDECALYMNSRYQKNLQVSKIEKFGYGVMMTQISATAPGMAALEKAGMNF